MSDHIKEISESVLRSMTYIEMMRREYDYFQKMILTSDTVYFNPKLKSIGIQMKNAAISAQSTIDDIKSKLQRNGGDFPYLLDEERMSMISVIMEFYMGMDMESLAATETDIEKIKRGEAL